MVVGTRRSLKQGKIVPVCPACANLSEYTCIVVLLKKLKLLVNLLELKGTHEDTSS